MSVAPNAGIVDLDNFLPPTASVDGVQGQVPKPLAGQQSYVLTGNGWSPAGSGSGTVTSVGFSGGATGLTATGSPITTSGTITLGGTLAVASGGTGTASPSLVAGTNITSITGTWPNQTINASGGSGTVTSVAATAGTGISVSGSPITTSGTLTITNTAPDQTVVLTQGGTTTITGTYPNFTISSADQYSGTVTSVSLSGGTTGLTTTGSPITTTGTITLGGTLAVTNGGTGRTVGNYSIYANEIHVGKDGNDTTGDGTLINPVLTITKALTLVGAGRNTVIVHPGSYSESPTVTSANTTIATAELTGANTQITGTLTLSAAARVSGIKLTNLTITGSGSTYISNCTVDTQVIKSGTNYVEIINTELQCVSGVQITGAGTVSIVGNKCWAVAVSNASASVLIKDCFQVLTPSVTAGTLQIDGSAIFAASPASNAVTSSVGSFITLANSFILNSAGTNVERVSLAGSYSILNLVYDKTNSTFAGTNRNAIDYFSVINADTLSLTNALSAPNGGTGQSAFTIGDLLYASSTTALSKLTAGANGTVLTLAGGVPTWAASTGGVTSFSAGSTGFTPNTATTGAITLAGTLAVANGGTGQTTYTDGQLLIGNSTGNTLTKATLTAGTGITITNGNGSISIASSGGSGTVTSVAATVPAFLTVTGSPITTSGTLAITLSGTALPIANGGTGSTTLAGASIATYAGVETLTYKRIDPRVYSAYTASSVTPTIASYDIYAFLQLDQNLTINAPVGLPVNGNKLIFRILDDGTARNLYWNPTSYFVIGTSLPTTTTASKTLYVGCIYNEYGSSGTPRWDVVAVTIEA